MAHKLSVFIFGAGKLGRSLARALRASKARVTLVPAREGFPQRQVRDGFVVLAVRDRDLRPLAEKIAAEKLVLPSSVCVHVAGALDAECLAPLRAVCAGVAQMHPMIAFADPRFCPTLEGGHVHVKGDEEAVRRAKAVARRLGMVPRTFESLDTVGYHAAAGLVANGAAALAAAGVELLERSGVPKGVAALMLGPLLRSVADNVAALGLPDALTGPVRRGEVAGVEKHLATLKARMPSAVPLYLASAEAQLPLARAVADAPAAAFDALQTLLLKESGRG